ncbi:hypothetical protein DFQ30_000830 [Apophysomyces sp. BC1015]|nr:hypothetical protein DFQ30_000830 [Apophysomyces sp. BC1015]
MRALRQHAQSHIRCPECSFEGLHMILLKHREMEHDYRDENESPRKQSPETPEELEKWLENRRRNFPRSQNLNELSKRRADDVVFEDTKPKKHRLDATKEPGDETFFDATDEWSERRENLLDSHTHLDRLSLIQSDTEYGEESLDERESSKELLPQSRTLCIYFARGWCRRGNACHFAHELPQSDQLSRRTRLTEEALEQRPNLLYTLYDKEIRYQRKIILQCLNYIVERDFFGASSRSSHNGRR